MEGLQEKFERKRRDALALADSQPVESICAMCWALHWCLGLDYDEIAGQLKLMTPGVDGLRTWIEGL